MFHARDRTEYQIFYLSSFISLIFFKEVNGVERSSSKRPNPHKYLLYKPTLTQLYVFLACGIKVSIHLLLAC